MHVHIVDPSAFTSPYDHALCRALGLAGADVELYTSRFVYGALTPAAGYERRETFYRAASRMPGPRSRRIVKLAEHVPDMLLYRRAARAADVVHFQWLTVQPLDVHLLPSGRPLVITAHDVLPREPRPGQIAAQRRLYERVDAVVVHSAHGRQRLVGELGIDPARVHVIPHGVLRPWEGQDEQPLPPDLRDAEGPVVLFFGLLRPYKGLDVLLDAWREIEGAQLWIVGMPRMDLAGLDTPHDRVLSRAGARHAGPGGKAADEGLVDDAGLASEGRAGASSTRPGPTGSAPPRAPIRFVPRFVTDPEMLALMRRASLVVLPYRDIDQSGVAFTALGAGVPLLLSDVGGFPELAATGAARTFPAGDAHALGQALAQLLGDPAALARMAERAGAAANGRYRWDAIARRTLELYRQLLGG